MPLNTVTIAVSAVAPLPGYADAKGSVNLTIARGVSDSGGPSRMPFVIALVVGILLLIGYLIYSRGLMGGDKKPAAPRNPPTRPR